MDAKHARRLSRAFLGNIWYEKQEEAIAAAFDNPGTVAWESKAHGWIVNKGILFFVEREYVVFNSYNEAVAKFDNMEDLHEKLDH